MSFSRKRFFITLGLSVVVWLISAFIQLTSSDGWPGFNLLGSSCGVTGYPFAFCLSEAQTLQLFLVYLLNIIFWFWIIHFFTGLLNRQKN